MWPSWLVATLTVLVITIFNTFIGLWVLLFRVAKRKNNPIDIMIVDYHKERGLTIRKRIGRFHTDPKKGRSLVSCGFFPKSIKENLGQKITMDDILASGEFKRNFVMLAHKDGVYSPFNFQALNGSFSLTPVKYEAVRFVLDTHKDAQDLYNDEDKKNARIIFISAITLFAIVVIGIIVLLSIMVAQGPEFANKIIQNNAAKTPSTPIVPGLPG